MNDWLKLGGLLVVLVMGFPIVGYLILRNVAETALIIIFGAIFGIIFWFILKQYIV